ncbi:MAG: MazG family protein [Elusimicrobiaceae bacterium]|nr:MazG family protein [Elusimicrobiaceae bacterium]
MKNTFEELVETFAVLRGPNGCPWDKKQTHESLIKNMREEAEELVAAIEKKDVENMKEELGDVLLQVLLHAQIAKEEGLFTIEDVMQGLYDKLHRRHPHVFGDHAKAASPEEALAVWKEMKKQEKGQYRHFLFR